MENLRRIKELCKKAHYGMLTPEAIEEGKALLKVLNHQELLDLRMSRYFATGASSHPLYETLVELLHQEQYEKMFEEFNMLSTTDLYARYKKLKAANCKEKILRIFLSRYENMSEEEQKLVDPLLHKNGTTTAYEVHK